MEKKYDIGDLIVRCLVSSYVVLVLYMVFLFLTGDTYENGYKDGQMDAMKGKWKYEMEIKQDTTYYENS